MKRLKCYIVVLYLGSYRINA